MEKHLYQDVEIPVSSGLYFLYGEAEELLYIGKAENLKTRLQSHFSGSSNLKNVYKQLKKFSIRLVEVEQLAKEEKEMIVKYKPKYNKQYQDDGVVRKKATFEINVKLHKELKHEAVKGDTTVSLLVERALKNYLKENQQTSIKEVQ